jgi:hypothetical protein
VLISWDTAGGKVVDQGKDLVVKLDNWRDFPAEVELLLTGVGLDQRLSEVRVGTFQLGPKQVLELPISLVSLPIQSVGAPAQIDASGVCTLPDGRDINLPVASLHVQFEPGYQRAYVSTDGGWDVMALGLVGGDTDSRAYTEMTAKQVVVSPGTALSVRTSDGKVDRVKARELFEKLVHPAVHPVGRYIDEIGRLVPLENPSTAGVPVTLRSDQMAVLDEVMRHGVPEDAEGVEEEQNSSPGAKFPVFGRYVTMCARWGVHFNDSGFGEDVLPASGYQTYPARYAQGQIREIGGSDYWVGSLDVNGCAPNTFLPYGDYELRLRPYFEAANNTIIYETTKEDYIFDQWWLPFTVKFQGIMLTTLTTPVHPASHVGAVVSAVLVTPDSGVGLTPGKMYQLSVRMDDDCGGVGAYSSGTYICLGKESDPIGGPHTTTSKVTIAHEFGHSVD